MEFLGIGPLELLFIVVIIVVVIGPKDIQRTMRSIGKGLNSLYKSEGWKAFNEVSRELRTLPNRLAREAELEEIQKATGELNQAIASVNSGLSAWTADGKKKPVAPVAPAATPPTQAAAAPPPAAAPAGEGEQAANVGMPGPAGAEPAIQPPVEGSNGAQAPEPASPTPAPTEGGRPESDQPTPNP